MNIDVLRVTAFLSGLVLVLLIVRLLRNRTLREKYAYIWILVGLCLVFSILFPNLVNSLSTLLGFELTSNFILASVGIILLFISMQLSIEVGRLEDKVQILTEELVLTKHEFATSLNRKGIRDQIHE
jgi:hypothetical protein